MVLDLIALLFAMFRRLDCVSTLKMYYHLHVDGCQAAQPLHRHQAVLLQQALVAKVRPPSQACHLHRRHHQPQLLAATVQNQALRHRRNLPLLSVAAAAVQSPARLLRLLAQAVAVRPPSLVFLAHRLLAQAVAQNQALRHHRNLPLLSVAAVAVQSPARLLLGARQVSHRSVPSHHLQQVLDVRDQFELNTVTR